METIIYKTTAKWDRPAYIKIVDDKVIFDDSDEEYGPIEFDIKLLINALKDKIIQAYNDGYKDGLTDPDKTNTDIQMYDNGKLYYNEKYHKPLQAQLITEVMNDDAKDGLYDEARLFNTAQLREITDLYEEGEISYGKMVDLINELAKNNKRIQ